MQRFKQRVNFPDSLIVIGALVGGTVGWYLGYFLAFLLGAHVAIIVGYLIEPSRRRLRLALGLTFLMWWPVWLGQWFWD